MSDDRHHEGERFAGLRRLEEFCQLGISRTGVDGMAVALNDTFGSLESVFSTGSLAERIAALEFTLGEGPANDSMRTGLPQGADDLAASEAGETWPVFSAQAVASGASAVHAFPLAPFGAALGAVSLYCKAPTTLSPRHRQSAVAVTELIGLSLIAPDAGEVIGVGLRMSVHQAAGMVMQQTGTDITDALVLLKATAFAEDLPIHDLANAVVSGDRRFQQMEPDHGTE